MRNRLTGIALAAAAWLVFPVVRADAQSLADVAKQEAARRGAAGPSGKVYTNTDLLPDFTKPMAPAPPPASLPADSTKAPSAKAGAESGAAQEADASGAMTTDGQPPERQRPSDKGEGYWRQKAGALRTSIAAQKAQVAALEANVQGAAKNGADRRELEVSSAALTKAKADLASLEDEQARFEALAKSKNVPSDWLQ